MRKMFLVHKWLSLVFSLPLLIMAITGLMLAFAPKHERPTSQKTISSVLPVFEILDQQRREHPSAQFMRANFSDDTVMVMLREKGVRLLKIDRAEGRVLSNTSPTDDIFVLAKIIHESFFLQGFGKNLVAISGIMLFIILLTGIIYSLKRLMKMRRVKNLKEFHIAVGVFALLPLAFSAVSGTLIEYNSFFFQDNKQIPHARPASCSWNDSLQVIKDRANGRGMIMFCRPDHPYISIAGKDGHREYTPFNQEVLFVPKADWSGQRGTRKHWFVHWHGGENFGKFEFPYQLLSSVPLLILIISGLIIWYRKHKRKHV